MENETILVEGKINILLDHLYGSSAKGQVCAAIADKERPSILIANHSTSASHTVMEGDEEFVFKALPSATFLCKTRDDYNPSIFMAASSGFEIDQVIKEMKWINNPEIKVYVHPYAVIVLQEHKNLEAGLNRDGSSSDNSGTLHLGSTMSGQSYAFADKMTRRSPSSLAKDYAEELYKHNIIVMATPWAFQLQLLSELAKDDATALAEMPQGFPLSIDHGPEFPYSTFRNITPMQLLADLGLNEAYLGSVIGNIRSLPIRVSNRFVGNNMDNVMLFAKFDAENKMSESSWNTPEQLGMTYSDVNAITYDLLMGNEKRFKNWIITDIKGVTGTSGPFEEDMEEISWRELSDHLTSIAGKDVNVEEITTLTKLNRRIAKIADERSLSIDMLMKFMVAVNPTHLSITFLNYIDPNLEGATSIEEINKSEIFNDWSIRAIEDLREAYNGEVFPKITALQTGKYLENVIFI